MGLGGLCSGLSYSFLRGQLKAARIRYVRDAASTTAFDDGFAALFVRYYQSYYGCKMRELSQA